MPDLWIHPLSERESLVVSNGEHWLVDTDAPTRLGPEGAEALARIASAATASTPPERDAADLVLDSTETLLAEAERLDRLAETSPEAAHPVANPTSRPVESPPGPSVAVWPFAGRWYRMTLRPGRAGRDAAEAAACLRATIPDPGQAAALCRPAVAVRPAGSESATVRIGPERPVPPETDRTAPSRTPLEPPPVGVLARWRSPGWEHHRFTPAPELDPVTGLVRRIAVRPPDPVLPPGFAHAHAELPHLASADARLQADALAPAGALDARALREAAILSGAELYCGAYTGRGERTLASFAELQAAGERALAIADWEPHDPSLHEQPGFPFARFGPDAPLWWIAGEESGERCWVPLSLVHVGWLQAGLEPATVFHGHNFTGMKAGRTPAEAAERACAHVAAHDAVALWWATGGGSRPHAAPVAEFVALAWGSCRLELRLLAIPSEAGVPVRLAVVDDPERDLVSLGFAADRSGSRASELAVVEALIQHVSARDLDAPDSLIRDAEALGNGAVAGLAPHDPERRYRDAFGPTYRGLIDPMCHVQFGLDPRVAAVVRERTAPLPERPESPDTRPVRSLLEAAGHRVVTVDATAERVRSAGLHAVRALVPGLARLQPAAFPLAPEGRIGRAAKRSGGTGFTIETLPYPGW